MVGPVAAARRPCPETWSAWLWARDVGDARLPVTRELEVLVDLEKRVDDRRDPGLLVADQVGGQPRSSWMIWRKIIAGV